MNKKIIIGLVIFIIIIAIVVFGLLKYFVYYDRYQMPKGAEISIVKDAKIKVYDETKLYELIKSSNVDILSENEDLYFNTVGTHGYTIEYKYNNSIRTFKFDIPYEVIDDTNPIFINAPASSRTLYIGESKMEDLTKKIVYADDYDVAPKLEVIGDIDFEKEGTYKLKFSVTDQSGNGVSKESVITVKERPRITKEDDSKEKEDEEDNTIKFEDHIQKYKTNNTMCGIDISKWQGEVDFEKVKEAGCEFVIMRLGVMKDKDTPLAMDKTFKTNFANAKKQGLKVGIYVYSESVTVESAIENAKFVIDSLDGEKLDFPVCFDWESWAKFNDLGINLHRLNEMYDAFDSKLQDAGYETMLYGSENYLNNTFLTLKDYTIWIAKYSSKKPSLDTNQKYILWQNANTGRIDGIKGDVDLDIFYK